MKVSELFPPKPEPITDVYPFARKHKSSGLRAPEALAITMRSHSYADRASCQYCGARAVTFSPYMCAECAGR